MSIDWHAKCIFNALTVGARTVVASQGYVKVSVVLMRVRIGGLDVLHSRAAGLPRGQRYRVRYGCGFGGLRPSKRGPELFDYCFLCAAFDRNFLLQSMASVTPPAHLLAALVDLTGQVSNLLLERSHLDIVAVFHFLHLLLQFTDSGSAALAECSLSCPVLRFAFSRRCIRRWLAARFRAWWDHPFSRRNGAGGAGSWGWCHRRPGSEGRGGCKG